MAEYAEDVPAHDYEVVDVGAFYNESYDEEDIHGESDDINSKASDDVEEILGSHFGLGEDVEEDFDFGTPAVDTTFDSFEDIPYIPFPISSGDALAIRNAVERARAQRQAIISENSSLALQFSNPELYMENVEFSKMIRRNVEMCPRPEPIAPVPADPTVDFQPSRTMGAKDIIFGYNLPKIYKEGVAHAAYEIRSLIWQFASLQPRVVEIRLRDEGGAGGFITQVFIPAIMRVNSESRKMGSRWFKVLQVGRSYTYVNYSTDTLYFCPDPRRFPMTRRLRSGPLQYFIQTVTASIDQQLVSEFECVALNEKIRFLAVDYNELDKLLATKAGVHFKNLRELHVVRYSDDNGFMTRDSLNFFTASTDCKVGWPTIRQILEKARSCLTAHPNFHNIGVFDVSRRKVYPYSPEMIKEHLRIVAVENEERAKSDILVAARYAYDLDKRIRD